MLQVEDEFFRDCDGNAVDVLGHTDVVDHLYAFRLCDCGGRGHCIDSVSSSQPVCECDPPFVGDHCDACPAVWRVPMCVMTRWLTVYTGNALCG